MSLAELAELGGGNRILGALPPEEYELLLPAPSAVSLELNRRLLEPGKAIDTIYFPVTAVVSLLTTMDDGSTVEVATIGNEGIVGAPVFLGAQAWSRGAANSAYRHPRPSTRKVGNVHPICPTVMA